MILDELIEGIAAVSAEQRTREIAMLVRDTIFALKMESIRSRADMSGLSRRWQVCEIDTCPALEKIGQVYLNEIGEHGYIEPIGENPND